MKSQIQKWGNSLALRIPKAFAEETHLEQNSMVEILLEEGKLVIVPAASPRLNLNELLSKINRDNIHHEIDTGSAMGKEVW